MSVVIGGGGSSEKWATLISFVLFGLVVAFVIGILQMSIRTAFEPVINATSEVRKMAAQMLNETVTVTTITGHNGSALEMVRPVNSPFSAFYDGLVWIAQVALNIVTDLRAIAAIIAITLIIVAVESKD